MRPVSSNLRQQGGLILSHDVDALLRRRLAADRRPPDGKLHPSGDLCGSLRHSQLRAAGAPTIESDITSDIRLKIGTLVHSDFERLFRGLPVMLEVKLDPWLPEGWSGTADWLLWDPERRAFQLGDLKTCKPESMGYILRDGVKKEHLWQVSSYYYACEAMGIPLVKGLWVYYLPTGQTGPADVNVAPSLQEANPLDRDLVLGTMAERWEATQAYLKAATVGTTRTQLAARGALGHIAPFLNDELAPVQPRELAVRWTSTASKAGGKNRPGFKVAYYPHWSTNYCPFPDELCDCRHQKVQTVGHYLREDDGKIVYRPSSATPDQPESIPQLTDKDIARLVKATTQEDK